MKPEHPSRLSKEQIEALLAMIFTMGPAILGFTQAQARGAIPPIGENRPTIALVKQTDCPTDTTWSEVCRSCVPEDSYSSGICPIKVAPISIDPTETPYPTDDPWHPKNGTGELSPKESGSEKGFPWGAIGLTTLALLGTIILTTVVAVGRHSSP
jgi:hypothetical protein